MFYKHLLDNQFNEKYCVQVDLQRDTETGHYVHFPADPQLDGFDMSDRKFAAAAIACAEGPPIVNALDTDWRDFRTALKAHGIEVEQVCPQHMA